jgi:hypothetical protein
MAIAAIFKGKKSAKKARESRRASETTAMIAKEMADESRLFFKKDIRPILRQLAGQASSGALPSLYADRAAADVTRAYGQAEDSMRRQSSRYGIDPSSSRYMDVLRNINLTRAAAEAGARTRGRRDAEAMNWARRIQAAAMGRQEQQFGYNGLQDASQFQMGLANRHAQDAAAMYAIPMKMAAIGVGAMTGGAGTAAMGAMGAMGGRDLGGPGGVSGGRAIQGSAMPVLKPGGAYGAVPGATLNYNGMI